MALLLLRFAGSPAPGSPKPRFLFHHIDAMHCPKRHERDVCDTGKMNRYTGARKRRHDRHRQLKPCPARTIARHAAPKLLPWNDFFA